MSQAALLDEEARRREREEADAAARSTVRDKKRILWEKHLARQREFHAEQEKRREAAVKDLERKVFMTAQVMISMSKQVLRRPGF